MFLRKKYRLKKTIVCNDPMEQSTTKATAAIDFQMFCPLFPMTIYIVTHTFICSTHVYIRAERKLTLK